MAPDAATPERQKSIDKITYIVLGMFGTNVLDEEEEKLKSTLAAYSTPWLDWILKYFGGRSEYVMRDRQYAYLLLTGRSEAHFAAYIILRDELPRDRGTIPSNISALIESLRHYSQFAEKVDSFQHAAQEDREAMVAVLSAVCRVRSSLPENRDGEPLLINVAKGKAIPEEGVESILVLPEQIVNLMLARPDDREKITDIMIKRGTTDTKFITRILDAPARALNVGIL